MVDNKGERRKGEEDTHSKINVRIFNYKSQSKTKQINADLPSFIKTLLLLLPPLPSSLYNKLTDHALLASAPPDHSFHPRRCGIPEPLAVYHSHLIRPNQCTPTVIQPIKAPLQAVWSLLSRFDIPQAYKHFLKSCRVIHGHGGIGTLREVRVVSGLPAACSRERLEILNDERHVVIGFCVVGGDHRLENYLSVTTVHRGEGEGEAAVVVVKSYMVDVPEGNTEDQETCVFVDTIVRCNLQSLANIAKDMAVHNNN